MGNIQNSLKALVVNGQIPEKQAMVVAEKAEDLLKRSVDLLTDLKSQVGMFLGGEISVLIADITRVKSKEMVYFHEKEPDGQ